jgi:hypothetical protein
MNRLTVGITALLGFVFAGFPGAQNAAAQCYPRCDYNHYYGPSNFTYLQPGLYGYPVCDPRGICSPSMVYAYSVPRFGNIEVRFPRRPSVPVAQRNERGE